MDRLNETLIALRRILRATDINTKNLGSQTGLTPSQLLVLQSVAESGEMTVGAIASRVRLTQATITTIVDRLQANGLVTRVRGTADKRKVFVRQTDAGRETLDKAPTGLHEQFSERFRDLPEWEQTFLLAALQRIGALMGAEGLDVGPLLDATHIDGTPIMPTNDKPR